VRVPLDGYLRHGHSFYRAGPARARLEEPGLAAGEEPGRDRRRLPHASLEDEPYPYVTLDALVVKRREGGRTVNVHAVGVNRDGFRACLTASRGLG